MSEFKIGDRVVRRVSYDEGEVVAVSPPHKMCEVRWGDGDEMVHVEYASDLLRVDDLSLQDEFDALGISEEALRGLAHKVIEYTESRGFSVWELIAALNVIHEEGAARGE